MPAHVEDTHAAPPGVPRTVDTVGTPGAPLGAPSDANPSDARGAGTRAGGSDAERALAHALRHVDRRERTEAELAAHLAAKGFDAAVVTSTIDRLTEDGLLDDTRFARLFVEDKRSLEGWGSDRISRALRGRGVDGDTVAAALSAGEPGDESGEQERAAAVLARRFPAPPRDRRERERAYAVLLRKGYGSDVALAALRAHTGEH